jgi:hypothetical protein
MQGRNIHGSARVPKKLKFMQLILARNSEVSGTSKQMETVPKEY